MVRWDRMRRSDNVEDRRGKGGAVIGGGLGLLVVLLIAVLFGADPRDVLQLVSRSEPGARVSEPAGPPADDETAQFVSAILGSTEDVWNELFAERGAEYREPELVLFDDAVRSACGFQSAATGPRPEPRRDRRRGDVEEGLDAAAAIGDDRMQRRAGRAVQPESFTHGSSAQRRRWLSRGLETGDPEACDTFADVGL